MLLRSFSAGRSGQIEPTYEAFRKTQDLTEVPCGVILQSEHSRLAGAIAQALSPEVFGVLNTEVIAAISHHDYGWDDSDQLQMRALDHRRPRPFTKMNAEETLPSWMSSIAHGRKLGSLAGVLISRHCCLLGTGSGQHAEFIERETDRRAQAERLFSSTDLHRWTAALGFCDLLSLYLCSGSQSDVILPLAHPQETTTEENAAFTWVNGHLTISRPILQANASFVANGVRYGETVSRNRELPAQWTLVNPK